MHAEFDHQTFGIELRKHRLALGWTAKQLALLYSEFIPGKEESIISPSFIYHLEAGKDMLKDKGRRAILAQLVGMPLTIAGVGLATTAAANSEPKKIPFDAREYTNMLELYCDTWQMGTTYKASKDIASRVDTLERAALYAPTTKRAETIELLCNYQILQADLVSEQTPTTAKRILNQTVQLAEQEKLYNIHAHALRQRAGTSTDTFEQTQDYRVLQYALHDFEESETIKLRTAPFYQALVDIRKGLVYAWLAQDKTQFTNALKIMDSSSLQIGKQTVDGRIAARLDTERYWLNRASAYLYSRQGSPKLALSELNEAVGIRPNTSPRRGVHRDMLFAETYLALGNYPMAVAHAEAAVEVTRTNGMDTLFNHLESIYQKLKKSPSYGNNPDVARLGVHIMQAHQLD